VKEN